jgi:hypothetical protein
MLDTIVARWLFEAGDEATKDDPNRVEPKGPPEALWAALTPHQRAVAVAFARLVYTAGLRRAQELAKEYVYLECDGGNGGECSRYAHVAFLDFDQALDAEMAKENK